MKAILILIATIFLGGCYVAPDDCRTVSKLLLIDFDMKKFDNEDFIKNTFNNCINKKQFDYERRYYQ